MQYRIVLLIAIFLCSTNVIGDKSSLSLLDKRQFMLVLKPLYNNIWGTIYNAEKRQCDNTPNITADGSRINPKKASKYRWIAISQEMINDINRANMLIYDQTDRFKGKIAYGDTVMITSPYEQLNGWWVVHDAKNARYTRSIDFLQTKGDATLYNNNPLWNGRFDDINIYSNEDWKEAKLNKYKNII